MIPAFHDYHLEPKITKCGDLLYTFSELISNIRKVGKIDSRKMQGQSAFRLIITNNQFQFDSLCIFFSFFFSSTRSNSPGIINPRDGITYSDVAFSALSHGGRYIVDFSLLASQIGNFNWIFRLSKFQCIHLKCFLVKADINRQFLKLLPNCWGW